MGRTWSARGHAAAGFLLAGVAISTVLATATASAESADANAVTVCVIDSGIHAAHDEFRGRVGTGFSAIHDGRGTDDCDGHGTHVAGIIGGATYGVIRSVTLVPVRVMGCDGTGTVEDLIAGVEWVTAHHRGPSVANLSVSAAASPAVDEAVARSIASGVTYTVAAGNDHTNACASSPARLAAAITVGSGTGAGRADYSNFGPCVDIMAPGTDIPSATCTGDSAADVLSGTSMAAPQAAGTAAAYLQHHPHASPAVVRAALLAGAVSGSATLDDQGTPTGALRIDRASGA
jgi:subtilisin family serine protease